MFWVMTWVTLPRRTSSATAAWPAFGFTAFHVSSMSKRRRQLSRRASAEATKSSKSIGIILVQMPPGERKSGMPDSVEMPAPVNTTTRLAARSSAASASTSSSTVCL
jgi:hypothetical protein